MKSRHTAKGPPSAQPRRVDIYIDTIGFDLRSLQVFLTVCETGNMTVAATTLGLTQPAISQVVANLERHVGEQLLDRGLRPLVLTVAGDLLRERAANLLESARQVVPAIQMATRKPLPSVRIGLLDSIAPLLTTPLATMLQSQATQLVIWSGLAFDHRADLVQRKLNMIVTSDALEDLDGFDRFLLLEEPFVKVVPSTEPSLRFKSIRETSDALPLIRYTGRSHIGQSVEQHLRRLGLHLPRQFEFDTTDQVIKLVENGIGWAITTPICLMQATTHMSRLSIEPLQRPGFRRRIFLVSHQNELGELPRTVAAIATRACKTTYEPQLLAMMPWLRDSLKVATR